MTKFLAIFLSALAFFQPVLATAGELVKPVPKQYRSILGENYMLVDETLLRELTLKAEERDIFKVQLDKSLIELTEFKNYSQRLEAAIKLQDEHIGRLNVYIDQQQEIIEDLAPTAWDRHKFGIGILAGGLIMGGAAYGLSRLE